MRGKLIVSIILIGCTSKSTNMDEYVIKSIDLQKYMGTWYEIARIPLRQEKNLYNVTATYALKDNKITVINSGYTSDKKRKSVYGKAWVPDIKKPGKLKVRFFWPFSGDYLILYVDEKYETALVCSQNAKYVWILSKFSHIDEETLNKIKSIAQEKGIDTIKFETVKQEWD